MIGLKQTDRYAWFRQLERQVMERFQHVEIHTGHQWWGYQMIVYFRGYMVCVSHYDGLHGLSITQHGDPMQGGVLGYYRDATLGGLIK